jgi:hypothetical protein
MFGATPLASPREHRRLFCASGHSFDVAKGGYVNLLNRRSAVQEPGDTVSALAVLRRLHDAGDHAAFKAISGVIAVSPETPC